MWGGMREREGERRRGRGSKKKKNEKERENKEMHKLSVMRRIKSEDLTYTLLTTVDNNVT